MPDEILQLLLLLLLAPSDDELEVDCDDCDEPKISKNDTFSAGTRQLDKEKNQYILVRMFVGFDGKLMSKWEIYTKYWQSNLSDKV